MKVLERHADGQRFRCLLQTAFGDVWVVCDGATEPGLDAIGLEWTFDLRLDRDNVELVDPSHQGIALAGDALRLRGTVEVHFDDDVVALRLGAQGICLLEVAPGTLKAGDVVAVTVPLARVRASLHRL